jgi:hypothetical protein
MSIQLAARILSVMKSGKNVGRMSAIFSVFYRQKTKSDLRPTSRTHPVNLTCKSQSYSQLKTRAESDLEELLVN